MIFRLLDLPRPFLRSLINQLDLVNLLELTATSTKFKDAAQLVKFNVDHCKVHIGTSSSTIKITKGNCSMVLETCCDPDSKDQKLWKIDGESRTILRHENSARINVQVMDGESDIEVFHKICCYLLSFLRVKKFSVEAHRNLDFRNLSIWEFTKSLSELKVGGEEVLRISKEDLEFLLEDVISESIELNIRVLNFKYQKPIKSENIICHDSSWLGLNAMKLHKNSKKVFYSLDKNANKASSSLLHSWTTGGADLKLLELVLQIPSNKSVMERFFDSKASEGSKREIRRRIDGHTGTIMKTNGAIVFSVLQPLSLCRLPYFALKNVINHLDLAMVVYLTMTSSTFLKIIQFAKYEVDRLELFITSWRVSVAYFKRGQTDPLKIEADFDDYGHQDYRWDNAKLNGKQVEFAVKNSDFQIKASRKQSNVRVLKNITMHLLDIFNVKKIDIECLSKMDFKNFFIWKLNKKIGKFKIRTTFSSPKELNFVLNDVKAEELDLDVKVPGKKYQGPLPVRKIIIRDSSWIDFNAITIDTNTVSVEIKTERSLNSSAINRLFKDWMAGRNNKLEELYFWCSSDSRNDAQIFEGLDVEESSISLKMKYRKICSLLYVPSDNLKDIKRATDGRIATIAIYKNFIGLFPWDSN